MTEKSLPIFSELAKKILWQYAKSLVLYSPLISFFYFKGIVMTLGDYLYYSWMCFLAYCFIEVTFDTLQLITVKFKSRYKNS